MNTPPMIHKRQQNAFDVHSTDSMIPPDADAQGDADAKVPVDLSTTLCGRISSVRSKC